MIVEISRDHYNQIYELVNRDIARNYFILLGLLSKKEVFERIYGDFRDGKLVAALFKRKSGTMQFYGPEDFDLDGFAELIAQTDFTSLIGPGSYCDLFISKGLFSSVKDGGYISRLSRDSEIFPLDEYHEIKKLKADNLDRVVSLYKDIFKGFSPREVMEEKLVQNRGRGFYIEEDSLMVSLVQSEFETTDAAVIVGVATHLNYRNKGYASMLLKYLINNLLGEKKDIYLQYENMVAGKIYERLGFKVFEQVKHYMK